MVCVVTGATGGLGGAICKRLAATGHNLVVVGRDKNKLTEIGMQLAAEFPSIEIDDFGCDLLDVVHTQKVVDEIARKFPKINLLVNNAAMHGNIGKLDDLDHCEFEHVFRVNFFAPVQFSKALLPGLRTANGSIVNISGGGATGPRPLFSPYASSKAALVRFTENLAAEERRINVNAVAPGIMPTRLAQELLSTENPLLEAEVDATQRALKQKDADQIFDRVCDLVTFLGCGRGRWVTGKLISAVWDDWPNWGGHKEALIGTDLFTLRRIVGRDRDISGVDL